MREAAGPQPTTWLCLYLPSRGTAQATEAGNVGYGGGTRRGEKPGVQESHALAGSSPEVQRPSQLGELHADGEP